MDTARQLGADLLISGGLHDLDGQLKLVLNLHEVATGELLSSKTASGRSLEELDTAVRTATPQLLLPRTPR